MLKFIDSDSCHPISHVIRIAYDAAAGAYSSTALYESDPPLPTAALRSLESFCFPISGSVPDFLERSAQFVFSFGVTDASRRLTFVFASLNRSCTAAICVVSEFYHPALLSEVARLAGERYERDAAACGELLAAAARAPLEIAGRSAWRIDAERWRLPLHCASRLSAQDELGLLYSLLFTRFRPHLVLALLSAALFEQKIVFMAVDVRLLGECCFAALALLHPIKWTGAFIPLLSHEARDALEAPVPFIIGVPSSLAYLVAENSVDSYLAMNPETHSAALVGEEDFDPAIRTLIDATAADIGVLIDKYAPVLPVALMQRAMRRFVVNTLRAVYRVDCSDPHQVYAAFKEANARADGSLGYRLSQTQLMQSFMTEAFEEGNADVVRAFWGSAN